MGEILTSKDLLPVAKATETATIQTGLNDLNTGLKDIQNLANTVDSILTKISQMRGNKTNSQQFPQGSPTEIKSTNERVIEKVVYQMKPIDRTKLKALLSELLIVQANRLPTDIKDKKVSELIGENFKNFKYNFLDVEISSDQLLELITVQMAESIDRINSQ